MFSLEEEVLTIIITSLVVLIFMIVAIVTFFFFSRKKIIKTELEKANMEIAHQKEVIQSTLITQEEERKRIAQDMHDAISSKLNVVSLNANFLTEENISSKESNTIGKHLVEITSTILESSRKIAHDLLPPTLEKFGLQAAIEELCEEIGDTKMFQVHHNLSYEQGFLSSEKELHLFRILQELMNNSIRHSEATKLEVSLKTSENIVYLQYNDDGKGFNTELKQKSKGLGMSGIYNRVAILEGEVKIISSLGQGIDVNITIKK